MNPSNASARAQGIQLLDTVLEGHCTFDEARAKHPLVGSEADQRFIALLARTTLRHLGQIDALLAGYLAKPLPGKRRAVRHALRLGVAQLLLLETPAHAAVNETVALVKKSKDAALAGLVNAVLQKIAREQPKLPASLHNVSPFLRARWEKAYGKAAVEMMASIAAARPPLDLNTHCKLDGERLDSQIIRLPAVHAPVETLPGYEDGAFFVQDVAASYPVRLLGEVRGKHVLDLCAAPGGKAAQLARAGAVVTSLDRSVARMSVLEVNMTRLGYHVDTIIADLLTWQPERPYDAILLDAPCTATGTWRRHPEVVHLVSADDIAELVALQREMLVRAWTWLKPAGKLVYCVCSLETEEGEAQAEWFSAQQKNAHALPIGPATEIPEACITAAGYLRTLPSHHAGQGGMDGFFAAGWKKD